jgi:hypothetical protein
VTTYSTQFFAGEVTGAETVYTAPATDVIVIRDLELWNAAAAVSDIAINLLSPSGSYLAGLFTTFALKVNGTAQWQGRVVMLPGQHLIFAATVYPVGCVISGYQLVG